MEWTPRLSVGVEQIDNQHKEIFKRVGTLLESMKKGQGRQEVGGFFEFVKRYVIEHFSAEERLMTKFNYPDRAGHLKQHQAFIDRVHVLEERLKKEGPTGLLVIDLQNEVGSWLINHIEGTDMALGRFLQTKK